MVVVQWWCVSARTYPCVCTVSVHMCTCVTETPRIRTSGDHVRTEGGREGRGPRGPMGTSRLTGLESEDVQVGTFVDLHCPFSPQKSVARHHFDPILSKTKLNMRQRKTQIP